MTDTTLTIEKSGCETVDKLVSHMDSGTGYDPSYEEVREDQVRAINERFQQRAGQIRLVGMRAEDAGITEITRLEDVVPLLLPHTAYKSYPESFLSQKKWDKLTKWLSTVSTSSFSDVDLDGLEGIDDWVDRLAEAGYFLSCSSGTTGNPAILTSTKGDAEFCRQDGAIAMAWGSAMRPDHDRQGFSFAMMTDTPRNRVMTGGMTRTYFDPDKDFFTFPIPPMTIGSITKMIELRKSIADGTAKPGEIEEYEQESAARAKAVEEAYDKAADAVIAARGEKLLITGMWGQIFPVAERVRNRGYGKEDFHPENGILLAGGLKRAQLPDNYKEFIYETFNLNPDYIYQMYGMQEIQTAMPRCMEGGRYHVPAWLVCLPLDKDGEKLVPGVGEGKVEGRAAFFDLSVEGRWGGVISGDHINIDYSPCACGSKSPSIGDDIYRYADLKGDDKIACSGTIDAYVRGMS